MSDDRPIAPSPARLGLAHAAGLRPDARWLTVGIACVSLSALLHAADGAALARSLRLGQLDPHGLGPAIVYAGKLAAVGAAAIVGASLLTRIAVGGLGAVSRGAMRRLGPVRVRASGAALVLATIAALLAGVATVRGGLAAAARTVAAPSWMLAEVYLGWATRGLLVVGGLACTVGLVEVIAWRSAARRSLYVSIEHARREARERQRKSPP